MIVPYGSIRRAPSTVTVVISVIGSIGEAQKALS
jgi:hypothetical protein